MYKLFYSINYASERKISTLISIGVVSSTGEEFYAEFTDFDENQLTLTDGIIDNVIKNLLYKHEKPFCQTLGSATVMKGTKDEVSKALTEFCSKFNRIEFWGDFAWSGYFLADLLDETTFNHVRSSFFDIGTLFRVHGINPDIDKEHFIDKPIIDYKYFALHDAKVIEACYEKIRRNSISYGVIL